MFRTLRAFLFGCLLAVCLFLASTASAAPIATYCPDWGSARSGLLFNAADPTASAGFHNGYDWGVALSPAQLADIAAWDASDTIWQGYDAFHPYRQYADARPAYSLFLTTDRGSRTYLILSSASDSRVAYVYAFTQHTPYADARGQHYGDHPCRVFRLPSADVTTLLNGLSQ